MFHDLILESTNVRALLKELEQCFARNENAEAGDLLTKLVTMRYTEKGNNIREYIMEMASLAARLRTLKLEVSEDLLIHFVLMSLPTRYNQLKVCYNTQKEKWTLVELISYCVGEEERLRREETETDRSASTFQGKEEKEGAGRHWRREG